MRFITYLILESHELSMGMPYPWPLCANDRRLDEDLNIALDYLEIKDSAQDLLGRAKVCGHFYTQRVDEG
jgi:hypothetical protein